MAQGSEHEQEIVILGNSAYGEILDTYLSKRTNLKSRYITIKSEDEKELDALLSDTSLVVCALDDCSFLRLVNINAYCVEKGIICVFVYPSNGVINIGPTVVPGSGHCICCSRLELVSENRSSGYYPFEFGPEAEHFVNLALSQGNLRDSRTEPFPRSQGLMRLVEMIGVRLSRELSALEGGDHGPQSLTHVIQISSKKAERLIPLSTADECSICRNSKPVAQSERLSFFSNLDWIERQNRYITPPVKSQYRTVGIVGGGSAGLLTALSFRKFQPQMEVTLIESSDIPSIRVGEATTPQLMAYMHRILEFDIHEFYERVRPTWKLGIHFDWGLPGTHSFDYPFDFGPVDSAMHYDGNLQRLTLMSVLMRDKRSPIFELDGKHHSALSQSAFAYHLDNERLVSYLRDKAFGSGDVKYVDAVIKDATRSADGEEITELVSEDGRKFEFDLIVDCTGFRSLLMGNVMESNYRSYNSSLKANRAIAGSVDNGGFINPYTVAKTMDNGWCWRVPMPESDHCGYVYSSDFCSDDEAEHEMRKLLPDLGDTRVIHFASGRHEHFWKGNVIALGNAYGFVEPLESTSIAVLLETNLMMHQNFPTVKNDNVSKERLNRMVAEYWDNTRWFLSVHYKFNKKKQTRFWQYARNETDTSGYDYLIEEFMLQAPLQGRRLSNAFGMYALGQDMLLFGQGIMPNVELCPREPRWIFERRVSAYEQLSRKALDVKSALHVVTNERPDLLNDLVSSPDSWMSAFYDYMSTCYF